MDGDLWGIFEDIEEEVVFEDEVWVKISVFYCDWGCVLLCVIGIEEFEEWIFFVVFLWWLGLFGG